MFKFHIFNSFVLVLSYFSEHAEADTFFCFTNLMSENRDNFIKSLDDSQCGITYKMESVYSMLKDKDLELYLKLVSCEQIAAHVTFQLDAPIDSARHSASHQMRSRLF